MRPIIAYALVPVVALAATTAHAQSESFYDQMQEMHKIQAEKTEQESKMQHEKFEQQRQMDDMKRKMNEQQQEIENQQRQINEIRARQQH